MLKSLLRKLKRALQAGPEYGKPGQLIHGAPLIVEHLDLSNIGLYDQDQKDKLINEGVPDDDFFLAHEPPRALGKWGYGYWSRKSDQGKKWQIYDSGELKLWKDIIKK